MFVIYYNISIQIWPSALSTGCTEPVTGIILLTLTSKALIAWVLSWTSLVIAVAFLAMLLSAATIFSFAVAIFPSKLDSAAKALSFSAAILESNPLTAWVLSCTSFSIACALAFIKSLFSAIAAALTNISSLAFATSDFIAPTQPAISSKASNLPAKTVSACLYSVSTLPIEVSNHDFIPSTYVLL